MWRQVLSIAIVSGSALAQPSWPEPQEYRLDNGMRVVLAPLPARRHVAVAVSYHAGQRDVPDGWTGLAHLTEHLMFTTAGDVGAFPVLDAAGATDPNGETEPDRTLYYEIVPTSELESALWMEASRMAYLLHGLGPQQVERQRQIVLLEGRERGRHGSIGRLTALLYDQIVPADHPYRRLYEWEEDVQAIGLPQVQWFFQTYYAPDNATIAIVGGFDPDAARAAIARYMGPIRRSGPAAPTREPLALRLPYERRIAYDAHTQHDELYIAWPTPPYFARGDAELDVVATLLNSREHELWRALVGSGLATEFTANQDGHELMSTFVLHAVPARGHHTGELLDAIDGVLRDMHANAPAPSRVEAARYSWWSRQATALENVGWFARHLTLPTPEGRAPTIAYERARYEAVTSESVHEVLTHWLPLDRRLVVFVASFPDAPSEGRVAQIHDRPASSP